MELAKEIEILEQHKRELCDLYDVASLYIFGSTARGSAEESSDVDIIVRFSGRGELLNYFDLKMRLEELLACRVDLVSQKALHPELREQIKLEAIRVA
jgi:predicted nucleotidyltransferase